ncbi:MAG: UDP-3-O-(3-hydroxymyristoyl)glucosamine N-acyltransferase, partial [Pseudomonadota bacterium]|nr:UDP-3-O-(3-hydroxymyristoyl)glucosamine N-acyltransferase [Pseudomonadota bacterium]
HCMIGGRVAMKDHIQICDQVILTGGTSATKSITVPGIYSSTVSALPHAEWQRNTVRSRQLDQLFNRVKQLEKAFDE